MPHKERETKENFSVAAASLSLVNWTEKRWDPPCTLPDQNWFGGPYTTSAEVSTPPEGSWYEMFESIDYLNSKFVRFNPCAHLSVKQSLGNGGIIRAKFYKDIVKLSTNTQCRLSKPNYDHEVWDADLVIDPGSAVWGSVVASSEPSEEYLSIGSSLFNEKMTQLNEIALDHFIPKLDTNDFSATVFLLELADLKVLLDEVLHLFSQIPRRVSRLFDKPLNEISDTWLQSIFGWIPFVSDIKSIVEKVMTVGQKVEEFYFKADRRMSLHFQKGLSPETFKDASWLAGPFNVYIDTTDPDGPYTELASVFQTFSANGEFQRTFNELVFHATIDFEYHVPPWDGFQQLLAELDVWGVNLSPSDIWEAVPFSFVIDWVFNVQGWLRSFDKTNIPIQVVIYDYCSSIKYELVETVSAVGADGNVNVTIGNAIYDGAVNYWRGFPSQTRSHKVTRAYYRWPGIPKPTEDQLPDFRLPSGMQWVTAGALYHSIFRK